MIINHNIAALNTYRMLNSANAGSEKSMEKLSSGLRINRAGDDAAGLAISEKMRGQIRGLEQASRNSQDGISMIQTAEGALNESHSILQRMRELAVQSSNDTNTATDRGELQKEVDELSKELSRIGETTEFNTKSLIDGSFDGKFQIGANEGQSIDLKIGDMRGFNLGVAGEVKFEETVTPSATVDFKDGTYKIDGTDLKDKDGNVVATTADSGVTWTSSGAGETITFSQEVSEGEIKIEGGKATGTSTMTNGGLQAGEYKLNFTSGASTLTDASGKVVATSTDDTAFTNAKGDTVLTLDAAATASMDLKVGGIDISDADKATKAITAFNDAIESVSSQRSNLGATQNRLEHTINNLNTSAENLTASESRIRDVDMASEMMTQTKNSILSQAAQAMLAKANQQPQGVLQLLR